MGIAVSAVVIIGCGPEASAGRGEAAAASAGTGEIPMYEAEAWPQVPNDWVLGLASGLATDSQDHIWIIHRPRTVPDEDQGRAAPAVLEFDADGTYIQGWGGALRKDKRLVVVAASQGQKAADHILGT